MELKSDNEFGVLLTPNRTKLDYLKSKATGK